MPNIVIDIASEFTGKKAFDQASKSTNGLEKSVNKLAKRLVSVYAAQKLIKFAGQTAKAFAEDEAAAQRLTSAVNNLGLGFEDLRIKQFIASLETTSSVLDDKLRPAMQALLLTTGSVIKSQELLRLGIDIAAGSGQDLETVANDLAQAYVGNTKGLKKYYLGLTQAELKAASFVDIQEKLNKQFSGANAYYLTTYAGQMSKLQVASANAQETIGKGLVEALAILGGEGGIDTIVNGMKTVAELANRFVTRMAIGFGYLKAGLTFNISEIKRLNEIVAKLERGPQTFGGVYADKYKAEVIAAEKAAEAKRLAQIKADKAAAAAKIAADKKAAANKAKLEKAASLFDLTKIQIAAALKGKISEEEKTRLLLMQAIANEDADKAEALSKKLEEIQKKNEEIAKSLLEIQDAKNPFADWVTSLTAAAGLLGQMPGLIDSSGALTPRGKKTIPQDPTDPVDVVIVPPAGGNNGNNDGGTFTGSETIDQILTIVENAAADAAEAARAAAESVYETQTVVDQLAEAATNGTPATGSSSMYSQNPYSAVGGPGYGIPYPTTNVYVTNTGTTIMQDEFVKAVADALVVANTNGTNTYRPGALNPEFI